MTSLWLDRPDRPRYPRVPDGGRFDVVVVGGGLTGLTTALLLARAGRRVAVVEARRLGAVTTGNTTGKVTLLQGTKLARIARRHGTEALRGYVEANREGQQWLLRYCADHDVPAPRRADVTFAQTRQGRAAAVEVRSAAEEAGLPVEWLEDAGLPLPTFGAVRLADQAQVDPLDVLLALAGDIGRHGGEIFEGSHVRGVRPGSPSRIRLDEGQVSADHVVLATGTPILRRGGFFARLEAHRSYAVALRVPGDLPHGMYISADEPVRSLRTTGTADDGERLVVGGSGHVVGRASSALERVADLESWAAAHFPGSVTSHVWSAQDYRSADRLPFVGPLLPGSDRVLVATGYDKWGLAMAVAAALALSGRILGGEMSWARAVRPWRLNELTGLGPAVRFGADVAARLAGDWARPRVHSSPVVPPEGKGRVELDGQLPVAVSTVERRTRRLCAVCPHAGGVVTWNDAEKSWDCPLHGSRFAADGAVLEGPATRPLPTIS